MEVFATAGEYCQDNSIEGVLKLVMFDAWRLLGAAAIEITQ